MTTRAPGTTEPATPPADPMRWPAPVRTLPPPPSSGRTVVAPVARRLPVSVVPLPPAARAPIDGTLPAPAAPPFAGLPEPRWCVLPALGWQARQSRPARSPGPAPSPPPALALPTLPTAAVVDTVEALPTRTRPAEAMSSLTVVEPARRARATVEVPAPPLAELIEAAMVRTAQPPVVDPEPEQAEPEQAALDLVAPELVAPELVAPELVAPDPVDPADTDPVEPVEQVEPWQRWAHLVARTLSFATLGALLWILALTTLPRLAGWQPTVITGHSMEPAIDRGDVVVVRPAPVAAYVRGAVITFADPNRPGRLITHRVVDVDAGGQLRTKGDHNRDADPTPIDPSTVRGRAVLRVPYAGRPVVWVMDRSWLPLGATVVVLTWATRTALGGGEHRPWWRRHRR